MSDNALKTFFTDVATAIRNKKGTTDKIKPIDFAREINNLEVGGADGDLVKHVIFMNYNGTEQLYDKPTISGDDCVDVVAKGLIDIPAKPYTNTQIFTHNGWSKSMNGNVDTTALKDVTEDRTVYASFQSSTRYYTVRFYSDGVLKKTVQVEYGQTAEPPNVVKNGYKLDRYEPSNENITKDTDINIIWSVDDGLIHDDWSTIASNIASGNYSQYKVGDKKLLDINYPDGTTETIPMVVAQVDSTEHLYVSDGTTNAKIIFVAGNLLQENRTLQTTQLSSSQNYWNYTELYNYLNTDFINYIPNDLKDSLISIRSKTVNMRTDTLGEIWIPQAFEVQGESATVSGASICHVQITKQFEIFKPKSDKNTFSKVGSETVEAFWVRDIYRSSNNPYATRVTYSNTNGVVASMERGSTTRGVLIAFSVG